MADSSSDSNTGRIAAADGELLHRSAQVEDTYERV